MPLAYSYRQCSSLSATLSLSLSALVDGTFGEDEDEDASGGKEGRKEGRKHPEKGEHSPYHHLSLTASLSSFFPYVHGTTVLQSKGQSVRFLELHFPWLVTPPPPPFRALLWYYVHSTVGLFSLLSHPPTRSLHPILLLFQSKAQSPFPERGLAGNRGSRIYTRGGRVYREERGAEIPEEERKKGRPRLQYFSSLLPSLLRLPYYNNSSRFNLHSQPPREMNGWRSRLNRLI